MSDKDLFEQSKHIAMFVAGPQDPCDAMQAVIASMFEDKTPGDEILKILTGVIIHMARTLDTAADSTMGALIPLLVLLYPGKPVEEIACIAAEMLKPQGRRRTVFIFQRRGD